VQNAFFFKENYRVPIHKLFASECLVTGVKLKGLAETRFSAEQTYPCSNTFTIIKRVCCSDKKVSDDIRRT